MTDDVKLEKEIRAIWITILILALAVLCGGVWDTIRGVAGLVALVGS